MRILYCTQYFPPEIGAPAERAREMVRHLAKEGHEVVVLTAFPNYPSGRLQKGYGLGLFQKEAYAGAVVLRSFVWTNPRKSFVGRVGNYLSFASSSLLSGFLGAGRGFDVVVGSSPPLFAAASARLLAIRHRAPFVFDVRDVWPEAAVALGQLGNPLFRRFGFALADRLYRAADCIICANPGNRDLIEKRLSAETNGRMAIVPNGTNVHIFKPLEPRERARVRAELGFEDRFVVLYAGLHGLMYDWDALLDAADSLRDDPSILFVLLGDGPMKAEIVENATRRGLINIRFKAPLPATRAARLMSAADVGMLSMRDLEFFRDTVPVKLYDYMAVGLPVVHSGGGFAKQITEEAGSGLCFSPGDGPALARAIRDLSKRTDERSAISARARELVTRRFDRSVLAKAFEKELLGAISGKVP